MNKSFALIAVCGILVLTLTFAGNAQEQSGPNTWTVAVGGQTKIESQDHGPAGAWQFMRFYPENITINAGDTIVWKLASAEPHTVTFPKAGDAVPELLIPEAGNSQRRLFNPLVVLPQNVSEYDGTNLAGSGQMSETPGYPTEYSLTFTNPGSYEYFCAFHRAMKGNVMVQPTGSPYPETQEQIDAEAASLLAADTKEALASEPKAKQVSTRRGSSGSTVYRVNMGYGNGKMAWMRFAPEQLRVTAGDSVEWIQQDAETPHTVTFTSGAGESPYIIKEGDKLILNPMVASSSGGVFFSGKGYFNSGLIWGNAQPMTGKRSYELMFIIPGTYQYFCALHSGMGMSGQITVLPKVVSQPTRSSQQQRQGQNKQKKNQNDRNRKNGNDD